MSWLDDAEKKRLEKEVERKNQKEELWQSHKRDVYQVLNDISRVLKERQGKDGIRFIHAGIKEDEKNLQFTLEWRAFQKGLPRYLVVSILPNKFGIDLGIIKYNTKTKNDVWNSIYKSDQITNIENLKAVVIEWWDKWNDLSLGMG